MSVGGQILVALGILAGLATVGSLGFTGYRLYKQRRGAASGPKPSQKDEALQRRRSRLRELFDREIARLRTNSGGGDFRYQMPWCMVLGGVGVGQSTLLRSTGLHSPFVSDDEQLAAEAGCHWSFYDKGVALDVEGKVQHHEESFQALLQVLRRERPRRPLDSLLLLIPASDLIATTALPEAEARKKAEELYQRLQQLQKELRVRVPIYVIISKADLIPGFVAFCGALSAAHREQIFGWSSPYGPDEAYRSEWLDEAFDTLYRTQSLLQLDLLAAGKVSDQERDSAFLFSRNVSALSSSLRVYLDQIFKSSVYSEPCLLRGVYFCGDATVEGVMAQAEGATPRRPSFLQQLMADKVFPEQGLARPLSRSLAVLGVIVAAARWIIAGSALLGIAALWSTCNGLSRDAQTVAAFLDKIPVHEAPPDRATFAKDTQSLLHAMGNVSTSRLRRLLLPSSWFSSLDDDVRRIMRQSFESVVLSGLRSGLDHKSRQLFGEDGAAPRVQGRSADPRKSGGGKAVDEEDDQDLAQDGPGAAAAAKAVVIPPVQAVSSMPEFGELEKLVKDYKEFGEKVEAYNRLGSERQKRLDTVVPLVKYVFDSDEFGESNALSSRVYEEALANASYPTFDIRTVSPRAERRGREIAGELHRRLFLENPIDLRTAEIERLINRLKSVGEWEGSDLKSVRDLRDMIQGLERDLEQPEIGWLAKDQLFLGPQFALLITSLGQIRTESRFGLGEDIYKEWTKSFRKLRGEVLERSAPEMGPMLKRDGEKGKLVVAPELIAVKTALDGFLTQSYVMASDRDITSKGDGSFYRVSWNEDLLRQALQLSDVYAVFVRDRLGQIYPIIRGAVKGTAKERLSRAMPGLVAQARRTERITNNNSISQDEVSGEVAELKRVMPLLRQVIETYEKLSLGTAYSDLARQVKEDTRQILTRIDNLFEKEDLYRTSRRLARWNGQRPPALDAFDVDDAEALAQYIKTQRNRMKSWARDFASAPVSMLEGLGESSSEGIMVKWKGIVRDLDSFEKMTPNNAVKSLESLIDTTMMTLTPDNCVDRLPPASSERAEYFEQKHGRIYNDMRRRCLELSEERLRDGFERLASVFRRDLEGKFPFTRRRARNDNEDADPRDVRAFYITFDEYFAKYNAFRNHENVKGQLVLPESRKMDGFLQSVQLVRRFFEPLISDKSGDALLRYSIGIEYRVNKQNEFNGSQIAEWSLSVANQRIDEPQAIWQLGDPIGLSLRWAKDGPYRPAQDGQQRGARVDKNDAVSFDWGGQWALLRFLRYHLAQESDLGKSTDRAPHVLKFTVPIEEKKRSGRLRLLPDEYYARKGTQVQTQAKSAYINSKAVVYVRFRLNLPDSKDQVVINPDWDWPAEAPQLGAR